MKEEAIEILTEMEKLLSDFLKNGQPVKEKMIKWREGKTEEQLKELYNDEDIKKISKKVEDLVSDIEDYFQ